MDTNNSAVVGTGNAGNAGSVIEVAGRASLVVSYDPKSSKAFAGQRLSKVQYKTVVDKASPMFGIKRESKCVSLEPVRPEEVIQNAGILAGHVVVMLHGVQDKMVKELIEAGRQSIGPEDVGIPAMLEWMEQNNDSGRITRDVVAKWFDDSLSDNLALVLADKIVAIGQEPTSADTAQVMKVVAMFKDKVSALAGGKTSYEVKVAESLKKVLALADGDDVMAGRFIARLDRMIEASKKDAEMSAMLVDML